MSAMHYIDLVPNKTCISIDWKWIIHWNKADEAWSKYRDLNMIETTLVDLIKKQDAELATLRDKAAKWDILQSELESGVIVMEIPASEE